jgi:hypothetical protein
MEQENLPTIPAPEVTEETKTEAPRISQEDCLAEIMEPLVKGYGFRNLFIGYTGSGKSNNNVVLTRVAKRKHRWNIITDQKNRDTAYNGTEIPSFGALAAVEKGDTAIIRGARLTNSVEDLLEFDEIGKGVWDLSQTGEGVFLGIDELDDACEGERVWLKGAMAKRGYMRLLYKQGRTNKISIAACTQAVQEIPRSAITNSDTLGIFRQDRKDLGYYSSNHFLSSDEIEIVSSLQGYDFLFLRRGHPSRICSFSAA